MAQNLGFWVTCGVKMMWLCHGWGWQPPWTASVIHFKHTQSVWAHWYTVHRHRVAALHIYTDPTWLRFWVLCHLRSQNDVIMSWLRLTATSNCFPHSKYTCSKCLRTLICHPQAYCSPYTFIPTLLGSEFWVLCHLWSQNDVIMSWLRLTATSNCFPHP